MKFAGLSLGFVLSVLVSAGCGNPSGGSCSQLSSGQVVQCIEFLEGYSAEQVQALCTGSANESYSSGGCTVDGSIGECRTTIAAGGLTLTENVFFYPPITSAQAMQQCSNQAQDGVTTTYTAH